MPRLPLQLHFPSSLLLLVALQLFPCLAQRLGKVIIDRGLSLGEYRNVCRGGG